MENNEKIIKKRKNKEKSSSISNSNDVPAETPSSASAESFEDEIRRKRDDTEELSAYIWLLFFSVLMFSVPFIVFYYIKHFLEIHYNLDQFQINGLSVLGAVVSVNLIICLYIWKSFNENTAR